MLEALLKRVNGLEKRLKDESKSEFTEDKDESAVREGSGDAEKSSNKQAQRAPAVEQQQQHILEPTPATALSFPEPLQLCAA